MCEDCGAVSTGPGYQGDVQQTTCPNCGSYRFQPNPTHSEMEMRNMPAPGEEDMGGNPLQEGFMADGGWQNRMVRDEAFASVRKSGWPEEGYGPYTGTPDSRCPNCKATGTVNDESGRCIYCGYTIPYDGGEQLSGHDDPVEWAEDNLLPTAPQHALGPVHQGAAPFNEAEEEYAMDLEKEKDEVAERIAAWDRMEGMRNNFYMPWTITESIVHQKSNVESVVSTTRTSFAFLAPLLAPLAGGLAETGAGAAAAGFAGRMAPSIAGHLLGNALEGHDGGGNAAPALNQPGAVQQPWESLSSVHSWLIHGEFEHPSSNPGFDDTDDPENVDQKEFNDGDHTNLDDDIDKGGGSDGFDIQSPLGQAFTEALPSLLKYYDAPESGKKDPAIAKLVHLVEQEMPGTIGAQPSPEEMQAIQESLRLFKGEPGDMTEDPQATYEDGRGEVGTPEEPSAVGGKVAAVETVCEKCGRRSSDGVVGPGQCKACGGHMVTAKVAYAPGIGGMMPAPGTQMLQNPVAQPGGQVAPHTQGMCPQCGARVTPGQGICPQCNGAINPAPMDATAVNPQAPVGPAGQAVPPVMASIHNAIIDDRFSAGPNPNYTPGSPNFPDMSPGLPHPNEEWAVPCPKCDSENTTMLGGNEEGPVNWVRQCQDCGESFKPFLKGGRTGANQGPHNPEQFKAVKEYLEAQGRPELVQDLIDHPENYGEILAEIQNKQQPPVPDPDAGPAPMPPPGAMPPQGMGDPSQGQMPMMAAVHGLAPKCPNCDSHTTEILVSDLDPGNMACHNCGHQWKKDGVVPTKTAFQHDDLHAHPTAAPAADQTRPDDPALDDNPGGIWATQDGQPLVVGQEYEMYSAKYDVPDVVRIESVKPDSISYTLTGEYGLEHRTEISRQEAEMDGITFLPTDSAGEDPEAQMNEQGPNDQMAPISPPGHDFPSTAATKTSEIWSPQHGQYQTELGPEGYPIINWPQREGLQPSNTPEHTPVTFDPDMQFPGAQERGVIHRGQPGWYHQYMQDAMQAPHPEHSDLRVFPQGTPTGENSALVNQGIKGVVGPEGANWYAEPGTDQGLLDRLNRNLGINAEDPAAYADDDLWDDDEHFASMRTAGAKYTPMEQRDLIDEAGVARNADKLDLKGTHYEAREQASLSDDFFLFGL